MYTNYSEKLEKSVHGGHKAEKLNGRDPGSLWRHCIRNLASLCLGYCHKGTGTLQKNCDVNKCKLIHYHADKSTFQIWEGNHRLCVLWPKKGKTSFQLLSAQSLKVIMWWYRRVLVPMPWGICTSVKAPLLWKGTLRFQRNIPYAGIQVKSFSRTSLTISSSQCHSLGILQQCGFVVKECKWLCIIICFY